MPHKFINLNTANPASVGIIIESYLAIRDHNTLLSMGLTQPIINELQTIYDTTLDQDGRTDVPSRFYFDFVLNSRIDPAKDMNIPGDLWKLVIRRDPTTDLLRTRVIGFGGRTQFGARQLRSNQVKHIVKYNEAYKDVSTAPPYNRFLTLFDSYGGWQSYIMRVFLTKVGIADAGIGWAPGTSVEHKFPWSGDVGSGPGLDDMLMLKVIFEERGYLQQLNDALSSSGSRIKSIDDLGIWKLPYGSRNNDQTLFEAGRWALIRAGQAAGYNLAYDLLLPEEKERLESSQARDWELEAYGFTFAPSSHLLVSEKLKRLPGGVTPTDTAKERPNITKSTLTYRLWKYSVFPTYFASTASYNNPGDPNFPYFIPGLVASFVGNVPGRKEGFIELGPGTRKIAEISDLEPVIEFPNIYDGTTFRPLRHPFGQLVVNDDPAPAIEFLVEMALHFEAIATWVEAGMPCDWPEWGNHLTPELAELLAKREADNLAQATRYIPTTTTSPTPPVGPKPGDQWFDTTTGKTKVWRETNPSFGVWVDA